MLFNFKKKKEEKLAKQKAEQEELAKAKAEEEAKAKAEAQAKAEQSKKASAKPAKTVTTKTTTKATTPAKAATTTKAKADTKATATTSKAKTTATTKATPAAKAEAKTKTTTKATDKGAKQNTKAKAEASKTKTAKAASKPEAAKPQEPTQETKPTSTLRGKFAYYRTAKGYYNYRLKASNNETIAVSGGTGYAALSGCKAGIESVRKNLNAPIEDQTLKNYETLANPKYVLFKDNAGKFRYRLHARNGELICTPEDGYSSKDACKKGIASLAKWAINSDIVAED